MTLHPSAPDPDWLALLDDDASRERDEPWPCRYFDAPPPPPGTSEWRGVSDAAPRLDLDGGAT